jgi:hypothetical protein
MRMSLSISVTFWATRYPLGAKAVAALKASSCMIDGEIASATTTAWPCSICYATAPYVCARRALGVALEIRAAISRCGRYRQGQWGFTARPVRVWTCLIGEAVEHAVP